MMYANRTHRNEGDAGIGIKVAVYPKSGEPEVSEVSAASPRAASEKFSRMIMEKVRDSGGRVPEEALRELIENLVHAEFRGIVVSVLEDGNVVRISDKGPGIEHKERAFEFGFSGASPEAVRRFGGRSRTGNSPGGRRESGGTVSVEDT
jgi:hypothetical protein